MSFIKKLKLVALLPLIAAIVGVGVVPAFAAQATTPAARVSFTFDDGLASAMSQAAPTLAKYGFTGTDYVITNCVGMATAPNTCHANTDATYMTWDQITQLKNTYGWEIGSHTASHPYLASSDASDGQPNKLTNSQVVQELTQSKSDLAAHGINATDFASPYGDYNQAVLSEVSKLYASHRGFADTGYNAFPNNDYIIRDQQVQAGVTVAKVKSYVDQAIAKKQWLVLTFHDIKTKASTNPDDYEYKTSDLDLIAQYVKSKNVSVINVSDGVVGGTNLLAANSSFDNGIANGWTTDTPSVFTKDTGSHGSYPNATNSIAMTSSSKNAQLYSPNVAVNSTDTYGIKNFINLDKISSGSIGYYIDEMDANGNWISGQYKLSVTFPWPQTVGFEYKPSSANVKQARLQIISTANSKSHAYLDNFQWFNENPSATAPTPPTDPTPPTTPPTTPTYANLMANSNFDAGIASGWTTDTPTAIVKDSASNGSPSNVVNSVKLQSSTKNAQLFSPKIAVTSTITYSVNSYLNIKQINSGVVGFYIDEYDANGNWISGQYKTDKNAVSAGNINISYTPSSANVKQASLQVIVVANSGIVAYVDDVQWLRPN
jgi:peptidoglycan/xylan/chitin deacetylase (PgdA/CDA1 family)